MRKALRTFVSLAMLAITGAGTVAHAQSSDDGQKIHVTAIAHIGDLIFASTRTNGVYLSSDGGSSWGPVNKGLPDNAYVVDLAANGTTLFAVGYKTDLTLFSSADKGASWKEVSVAPKATKVYSATVFKNKVFAATDVGLFRSADNGANWVAVPDVSGNVLSVVASGEQMLASVYKNINRNTFFSSNDGEDWRLVKGDDVSADAVKAHGNMIVGTRCAHSFTMRDLNTCKASQAWVLSGSGKKWEEVDMKPRYFGFDGDENIYAINTSVEKKKKDFIYHREVLKSEDKGKSWKEVDEKTDPFVTTDPGMQADLAELDVWRILELQEKIWEQEATARSDADKAAREAELQKRIAAENARFKNSNSSSSRSSGSRSSATPDYRALSNDRFKEMHNHRDTWIDSKGKIH